MTTAANNGRSITFLHVADMHLGAPVRGLASVDSEWAARLARAIPEAFERVIRIALSRKVDFVVLAGDAFDSSRPSYAERLLFFEGLSRLDAAGIPLYMVAGNHDPYTVWARDVELLPESARMLGVEGPEYALFCRDDEPLCLIGGRSYFNQTWPSSESIIEGLTRTHAVTALGTDAPFAVGVVHTGLDLDKNKAPADDAELLESGFDYWACGHLHRATVRPSYDDPRIVSSGCIQGRDIKETGERGCFLVTLTEAPGTGGLPAGAQGSIAQIEFVPTSSVLLEHVKVDVSACRTLGDLVRHVAASLFAENGKAHCDEMVTRITLTGETRLHRFLAQPKVLADLRKQINDSYPTFFCDALIDRTTQLDTGEVHDTQLFQRVFADIATEQRVHDEASVNYVQHEFVKRGISVPASLSRHVAEFNDVAEALVADLLREEDE